MRVAPVVFALLVACAISYAAEMEAGPVITMLQGQNGEAVPATEVSLVEPGSNRQKRGLLLGALGAGVLGAGVLGVGALGAGVLGAKVIGAGIVGGAIASKFVGRGHGGGYGGYSGGYGGGYGGYYGGHYGGYGGYSGYRSYYAPTYIVEEGYY